MKSFQQLLKKIYKLDELISLRKEWKDNGLKVVFTNGCFDLIHQGHINYLSRAADLGDKFIMAVNSDASVSLLKGEGRPIKDEQTRMMLLAAFSFTDAIFLFEEETPARVIDLLIPDILVKGGDYKEDDIVGADTVKLHGGKVVVLPFIEGFSTTNYEQKIIENYKRGK